jgi:hypothetical protein
MALGKRRTVLRALTGGCNHAEDVFSVQPDEAYRLINCHIDDNGRAFTRKGKNAMFSAAALNGAVTSIYDFRRPDGSSYAQTVLVTAGEKVYTLNTSTGVATESTGLNSTDRPDWATFQDSNGTYYAFMCNGTDFFKFDGTTWTNAAASYPWTDCQPRYLQVYDNRLLASGLDSDPRTVFVSGLLDGTDWLSGEGSTAVYWSLKSMSGDRVTGLGAMYNYGVLFTNRSIDIITEADADSTTSEQITVSYEYGTTSNWSIQSISNVIYFADEMHIYRGVLRQAIDNGLEVYPIDGNVQRLYGTIGVTNDIVSVYDAKNREIYWSIQVSGQTTYNKALVYNLWLSGDKGKGHRDIWSGWFEGAGFEAYSWGSVLDSTGKPVLYCGDEAGYVYSFDVSTQYKDETVAATVITSNAIITDIWTGAIYPYDISVIKRARTATPKLYSKQDGAAAIQWIVDGRYCAPEYTTLTNLVPEWNAANLEQAQVWGDTVVTTYNNIMSKSVTVDEPFKYIQFRIRCLGTNDEDEISYVGLELWYQTHNLRRDIG